MLAALIHSDLSAIHDLAVARSRLGGHLTRPDAVLERDTLTARLVDRIAALSGEAQAELRALVRLGCTGNGNGHVSLGDDESRADWSALVAAARTPGDACTPHQLAERASLDECIERGLLKLDGMH